MDISQRSFNCDETPTPTTRFIRNCEEVGLFQDLQSNPFDEIFRNAAQTKHTTQSLPEPLSKSVSADTLDTPQVVPNAKRIEDYRNSYPIIEDDDDEIKLPNNDYLIRYIVPEENSLSNDNETPSENLLLVQNNESIENQNEQIARQVNELEKNVIDLTESPVKEQTYNFKPQSVQNEAIEEIFLEGQEIMTDASITNEFLLLHNNKNNTKENTYSSTVLSDQNLIFIPSKNNIVADNSFVKITPKHVEPKESSIKQKLKKLLKPSENNVTQPIPMIIQNVPTPPSTCPSGGEMSDDKLSYSRERNRMAQKRCRLKKKEWITQLKQETESVYSENKNLRSEVVSLKAEVAHLKTLLLAHKNCPVTLAMYQANLSNVVPNEPPIPQISTLSANVAGTPIPYTIISTTGTQNVQIVESITNQNKKIIVKQKKIPIPQLKPIRTSKSTPKSYTNERKQSLKVIIDQTQNINTKPIVNSPNAVNVICYNQNQNIAEVTDLTYDCS